MECLDKNSNKNTGYQKPWVETQFVPTGRFSSLHMTSINKSEKKLSTQFKEVKITNQECKKTATLLGHRQIKYRRQNRQNKPTNQPTQGLVY